MKSLKFYLKKLQPSSLFSRFLIIILVPWVFLQLITIYVFFERHWEGVNSHMKHSLIGDVNLIIQMLEDKKYQQSQIVRYAQTYLQLNISTLNFTERSSLDKKFQNDPKLDYLTKAFAHPYIKRTLAYQPNDNEDINLSFEFNNSFYNIEIPKKRLLTPTTNIFIAWLISAASILIIISIIFMRNQVRSIIKLAAAAENFGRGQDINNFKPEGAKEVRVAGSNFLKMKERLEQQINQRTLVLAGVSHDLKTPLTRVKLQLAMLEQSEEIKNIQDDIQEMQYMLNEYLDLISSQQELEEYAEINIIEMIKDIVNKFPENQIQFETIYPSLNVLIKPFSIKRAITNVIENALKYGELVWITIKHAQETIKIIIEDNGSGIPKEEQEKIFKPFYRADYARNLNKSGAGLGLAISLNIILTHGGNIYVSKKNYKLNGASFVIEIPA